MAAIIATGLSSCEKTDYPDRFHSTDGVPTIIGVRYADSGIHIEQAFMEEVVCIMGENLRSVHDVWFNDQQAILNTSYITDNTLIVQVPKTMPVEETDKIYLNTVGKQTVEYSFRVLPPAPRVQRMSFEYAEDGQEVTIYGNYFYQKPDSPLKIEFPNADAGAIADADITLTSVKVKVPAGSQMGKVKVTTASGTGASEFVFRDDRGLLFDFDGTNGLYTINHGWHACPIVEGGIGGSMCMMMDASGETFTADGGDWHDGTCHFEYWAGNWQDPETYGTWDGRRLNDLVDFSNYGSMVLKFEVKIPESNPWTGCPMQIIFSDVTLVSNGNAGVKDIYGNTLGGCNNTYFNNAGISLPRYFWRPWADGLTHTNGEWMTVSVPIANFTSYWDGSAATGKLSKESFANLEFFFAGGTSSEGSPCSPIVYVDNIRAVPAK
ncbi:MAG: hypothetical protein KBS36_01760 [Bacteroidales bacterium]|nr:hypothetical protein [Candidatus Cryptobacteroides fimicaballi]